jgi:hypothetical protein
MIWCVLWNIGAMISIWLVITGHDTRPLWMTAWMGVNAALALSWAMYHARKSSNG